MRQHFTARVFTPPKAKQLFCLCVLILGWRFRQGQGPVQTPRRAYVARCVEQPIRNPQSLKRVPQRPKDYAGLRSVARCSEGMIGEVRRLPFRFGNRDQCLPLVTPTEGEGSTLPPSSLA